MTNKQVAQSKALADLDGLREQIEKGQWLNVHFRAFRLAWDAWQNHVFVNAQIGSESCNSPGGAVLDDSRDSRD